MDNLKKGSCGSDLSICGEEAGCHEFENGTYICICTLDLRIMDPIRGCNLSKGENNGQNTPNVLLIHSFNKTILNQFNKFSNNFKGYDDSTLYILLSLFTCIMLVFLIFISYVCFKRRRLFFQNNSYNNHEHIELKSPSFKNLISNQNYYTSSLENFLLSYTSIRQFEIKNQCIKIEEEIGEGCFGKVFKGEYKSKENDEQDPIPIAIKMIKNQAADLKDAKEFFLDFDREIKILSKLNHRNIIKFLGVVRLNSTDIAFSMIFEFMPLGDLNQLLRHCTLSDSENFTLSTSASSNTLKITEIDSSTLNTPYDSNFQTVENKNILSYERLLTKKRQNNCDFINELWMKDLLWISSQISAGMLFLQQHNCTHRDLATRNCLLDENFCVKITDFGMSREIYNEDYYRTSGNKRLPVRWMAPESILFGKFTYESDVWSYGVVLWEIFSFGKQPYYGHSNTQAIQLILDGHLLSFNEPHEIPPVILNLMSKCWRLNPENRIKFSEILNELTKYCTRSQKELLSIKMPEKSLDNI